ncbi:hypothetical protein KW783_02955 [Candidatus Parcubacteria bacterium]|nr:hypothetical protein [Candidatus Parcubacteria bacterium]
MKKIAIIGGIENMKQNLRIGGNANYRLEKWRQWWDKTDKKSFSLGKRKTFPKPPKSEMLAEFVGIMIGDGGVAPYHISVTLHSTDEKKYSRHVCKLIQKLFFMTPKIYQKKNSKAIDIVAHGKNLVEYCRSIGLPQGNKIKQKIDIPVWIKLNQSYSLSCIRGLIDTDGSFYEHSYMSKGKQYSYVKMSFTNGSYALILSVRNILIKLGFSARIVKNLLDVRVESKKDIDKYVKLIGTHNPKHQYKLSKWKVAPNGKAAVC